MPQMKQFSELVNDDATATADAGSQSLTFTMPRDGILTGAFLVLSADDVRVMSLEIVRGGTTYIMFQREASSGVSASTSGPITLLDGDVVQWTVTTGVDATTADAGLFGEYLDAD